MPGSHWMLCVTPDNYRITAKAGFSRLAVRNRHRKKAERMQLGDRILFYVLDWRVFPASATVTASYYQDHAPFWVGDSFPHRVPTEPALVLEQREYVDAYALAPRLLYVKRWPPELWPLAFQGDIHLLSSTDFDLIEHEMRRLFRSRPRSQVPGPESQVPGGTSQVPAPAAATDPSEA